VAPCGTSGWPALSPWVHKTGVPPVLIHLNRSFHEINHPAIGVPFMEAHQVKIETPSWSEASRAGSQGKLRNEDGLWQFMDVYGVYIYIHNMSIYICV
jgi:hypothetical protein